MVIQRGGVYSSLCQDDRILLQQYAIEMGVCVCVCVSRCFSKVSGSGVDVTP